MDVNDPKSQIFIQVSHTNIEHFFIGNFITLGEIAIPKSKQNQKLSSI
jgi:hypothetical protein